ncbi:MAG: thiamine phosphate synthase [Gemmatimonadota bacterium]|nr:thiamine phosphate synthase [Gemmatimonadota bacterium]
MEDPLAAFPQLHVLTDSVLSGGRDPREIARAAWSGGADCVQLREKSMDLAMLAGVADRLANIAKVRGRLFVVNDRLDVALAANAGGLHVGPEDMPVAAARRRWLRPRVLGGSARTVEAARQLARDGADYLGVGPVFATSSKRDAGSPIGLETLARIAAAVPVPVLGIGGVSPENAASVLEAGAAGVAVISAVVAEPDVEAATRALREALDRAARDFPTR